MKTMAKRPRHRLGTVIAERVLDLKSSLRSTTKVIVRIGRPRRDRQLTRDWYCPIRILGIGMDRVQVAYGIDSVQALQLAQTMIAATLVLYYQRLNPGTLTWLGNAHLGFPLPEMPDEFLKRERAGMRLIKKKAGRK